VRVGKNLGLTEIRELFLIPNRGLNLNSRKKERRVIFTYLDKDRRKTERRGAAQRKIDQKKRKEFERHLAAQR